MSKVNKTLSKSLPLIILYGLPGVGKYTVAKELHKITNLPLFHNHLSKDLVDTVFPKVNNFDLIDNLRLSFFRFASENNQGLIFTFFYGKGVDDNFMDKLVQISTQNQRPIYFIQLTCQERVLKARVENENRSKYKKVRDFNSVKDTLTKYDLFSL